MPWVAESLLRHKVAGIEGVYNKSQQIEERRRALALWAGELSKVERAGVLALAVTEN